MDPNARTAPDYPTKTEILFGGEDIAVVMLDSATELVRVKILPIRQFPQYQAALSNEPKLVELFTGKPAEWVDQLSTSSFEEIILSGERINSDFFGRWQDRQKKRANILPKQTPEDVVKIISALADKNPALFESIIKTAGASLPTSSPNSLANAESAATKP